MLKRKDVLSLGYLKKTTFNGSFEGVRFRLQKTEKDGDTLLKVWAWPEPFSFDQTAEEQKISCELPFHEEGIEQAVMWLNEQRPALLAGTPSHTGQEA